MKSLDKMQDEVWTWAESKGWEPQITRSFGDECALLHSEVSEALEAYRIYGHDSADILGKPVDVASEFADVLIRLLHYTRAHGIDLEHQYERKMAYNRTRAYRHGGKSM